MTCPACNKPVEPMRESYFRDGWHESCAMAEVWANTPTGRRVMQRAGS